MRTTTLNSTGGSRRVKTGLEVCVENVPSRIRGRRRIGLLMHQASVNHQLQYASDVLAKALGPERLACIFSPQHGIWGEQQANMIETPHTRDARLGIPIYSLYSETRRPTQEMLAGLDLLIIDLQDVGTRIYTYVWTMMNCLSACADAHIPVVVLDRPNPLGGMVVEGPILRPEFRSFVGQASIPMRHGLTIAELAQWLNQQYNLGVELSVVPMQHWQRHMLWTATKLPWVLPSPNMPTWNSSLVYPGQVLLEGANLSEGRGTTTPFELVGAPFIDPYQLIDDLYHEWGDFKPLGLILRPTYFVPTFDKWQGRRCGGLAWHTPRAADVRSYEATIRIMATIRRRWPDQFSWLSAPYEYETVKPPIDILSGDDRLRTWIDSQCEWEDPAANQEGPVRPQKNQPSSIPPSLLGTHEEDWWNQTRTHLLY